MEYIEWTDDYSVGIERFDEEHRRLIGYINELHHGIENGLIFVEIKNIIEGLIDYTFYHFRNEENLMAEHSYNGYVGHKKEHNDLTLKVRSFQKKLEDRGEKIPLELISFLRTWLIHHILNTDMKYKRFFKDIEG